VETFEEVFNSDPVHSSDPSYSVRPSYSDPSDYYYFNEGERKEILSGVKNFNINNEILAALIKANTPLPSDDNELLYNKKDVITSRTIKGNFERSVHVRLTAIAKHDMLIIINVGIPHANLGDIFKSTHWKMVFAPKLLKQPQKCTFVKLTEPVRQNGADLELL
jgi:hypothetical protein